MINVETVLETPDKEGSNTSALSGEDTVKDNGWRGASGKAGALAEDTVKDGGWRIRSSAPDNNGASGGAIKGDDTVKDGGWRNSREEKDSGIDGTDTVRDEGWREKKKDLFDDASSLNKSKFSLAEFKETAAQLKELVSFNDVHYPVSRVLTERGGESAVLLCYDQNGNNVVAKIFYESAKGTKAILLRSKVLEYMETDGGQEYTVPVSDYGFVSLDEDEKHYFEIMPYCADGDLAKDPPLSFEKLVELTERLNNALHDMHTFGLLHRDIKPMNLYHLKGKVVIGDFGVAKIAVKGRSDDTVTRVGTDGYTAPEVNMALTNNPTFSYDTKCDYYSLGITLASLFEGHFVYDGMDYGAVMNHIRSSRVPVTRIDAHREECENLFNGLCRFDPLTRFGYKDVQEWLKNHFYSGTVSSEEWPHSFRLLDDEYADERSMFFGIAKDPDHWNEGCEMLFNNQMEHFFRSFRTDYARAAQVTVEEWRKSNPDKGLSLFLKKIYRPGPLVWRGRTFSKLSELANAVLQESYNLDWFAELFRNKCVSDWLSETEGIQVDERTVRLVDKIEALSVSNPDLACYWFANSFADSRKVTVNGKTVADLPSFIKEGFSVADIGCIEKIMDHQGGADVCGFLYSYGFDAIEDNLMKNRKSEVNLFEEICLTYEMIDLLAVKQKVDPGLIRQHFITYGPIAVYSCVQKLVKKGDTYKPLDSEGRAILSGIAGFTPAKAETVSEIYKSYLPLITSVGKMTGKLNDNLFGISNGFYYENQILCVEKSGVFGFYVFGINAPIDFYLFLKQAGVPLKNVSLGKYVSETYNSVNSASSKVSKLLDKIEKLTGGKSKKDYFLRIVSVILWSLCIIVSSVIMHSYANQYWVPWALPVVIAAALLGGAALTVKELGELGSVSVLFNCKSKLLSLKKTVTGVKPSDRQGAAETAVIEGRKYSVTPKNSVLQEIKNNEDAVNRSSSITGKDMSFVQKIAFSIDFGVFSAYLVVSFIFIITRLLAGSENWLAETESEMDWYEILILVGFSLTTSIVAFIVSLKYLSVGNTIEKTRISIPGLFGTIVSSILFGIAGVLGFLLLVGTVNSFVTGDISFWGVVGTIISVAIVVGLISLCKKGIEFFFEYLVLSDTENKTITNRIKKFWWK